MSYTLNLHYILCQYRSIKLGWEEFSGGNKSSDYHHIFPYGAKYQEFNLNDHRKDPKGNEITDFIQSGGVAWLLQLHWEYKYGLMNSKIQIPPASSSN